MIALSKFYIHSSFMGKGTILLALKVLTIYLPAESKSKKRHSPI
jgi:hypothetical protein